ncbi:tRNA pseudouridine(38-40) synthase TruA [Homoserinimonas sp. OAct 916]|uniref:tRNA pseudouridine synthase A n=1 Tax=Homoserinimonas sp. OAct 916 TaxID=2211450 RepID=UPI001E5A4889|nr:tRNA pseudouridine synthase A [Homoserinimonas sp. OAct 916]
MIETTADANVTPGTLRFRLDIAYDGTDFHGWAVQPRLRTVQGTVESALAEIFRRYRVQPRLVVAGRTDAGVHAAGQVAHLDLAPELVASLRSSNAHRARRKIAPSEPTSPEGSREVSPEDNLADNLAEDSVRSGEHAPARVIQRRLRGILSAHRDIVVTGVTPAPAGFDARFSAVWRRYQYRVADTVTAFDPLQRHRTEWYPAALDVHAMDAAASTLLGLHDFAAYCRPRDGSTTIRTLQHYSWHREHDGVLVADITADAFCHSMVRALVGACAAVGAGRLEVGQLARLRDQRERTNAFRVMAARGLTLMEVGYPPDHELGIRALQTRAHRTLA